MAKRGPRPKPAKLRGIKGGKASDNTPKPGDSNKGGDDGDGGGHERGYDLIPPKKLTATQQEQWDNYIQPAWWLTDWDIPNAYAWVVLWSALLMAPHKMQTSRITEMRRIAQELHLTSGEQARAGLNQPAKGGSQNPARFF